jgi:hypothetical protein
MSRQPIPPADAEARADAAMREVFAGASRPPLGDEAFVSAVMGKVAAAKSASGDRVAWALGLALAGLAAIVVPHIGQIGGDVGLAILKAAPHLTALSTQAAGALLAITAAAAGWLYTERG